MLICSALDVLYVSRIGSQRLFGSNIQQGASRRRRGAKRPVAVRSLLSQSGRGMVHAAPHEAKQNSRSIYLQCNVMCAFEL